MELWWNVTDTERLQNLEINLSHCHFVHTNRTWNGVVLTPGLSVGRLAANCLSRGTAPFLLLNLYKFIGNLVYSVVYHQNVFWWQNRIVMALDCVETVGYYEEKIHITICIFKFWFQIERWENGNCNYWQGSRISGTPEPLCWIVPYLFAEDWTFILQVWSRCPETKAGKIIFLGASVRLVFLLHVEVSRIIFICRVLRTVVISCCLGRWDRLPVCLCDGSSRFVGNIGTPLAG